jgi:hypothetical protein
MTANFRVETTSYRAYSNRVPLNVLGPNSESASASGTASSANF